MGGNGSFGFTAPNPTCEQILHMEQDGGAVQNASRTSTKELLNTLVLQLEFVSVGHSNGHRLDLVRCVNPE
jgi:hypothetical protein